MSLVNKVEIKPGYRTDHSSVELKLKLSDFNCGRGFWKFNNSLLYDKKSKYAFPVYNFKISNILIYEYVCIEWTTVF